MSKFVRFSFIVVLILFLPAFVSADYAGDIDGDGKVDLDDLVLIAGQWLNTDCTANPSDCADIANTGDGVDLQDYALLAEYWLKGLTSVVINEFMAVNTGGLTDEDNESSDWIELYNTTLSTVDLKNWSLTDNAGNFDKWKFPDVQIGSGQYLVIFASGKDRRDPESELHTNFSLSGSGEYLALVNSDGVVAHEFSTTYPQQFGNVSYGLSTSTQGTSTETILVPEDDTWRYYEGITSDPSDPDDAWRMIGYDDNPATTDWEEGDAPLGYGDGFIVTNLSALDDDSYISSLYLRHEFTVADTSAVNQLRLDLFCDDGSIVWINGQEV